LKDVEGAKRALEKGLKEVATENFKDSILIQLSKLNIESDQSVASTSAS
jgi:hypothetical protein